MTTLVAITARQLPVARERARGILRRTSPPHGSRRVPRRRARDLGRLAEDRTLNDPTARRGRRDGGGPVRSDRRPAISRSAMPTPPRARPRGGRHDRRRARSRIVWAFVGGLVLDVLAHDRSARSAFALLLCVGAASVLGRVLARSAARADHRDLRPQHRVLDDPVRRSSAPFATPLPVDRSAAVIVLPGAIYDAVIAGLISARWRSRSTTVAPGASGSTGEHLPRRTRQRARRRSLSRFLVFGVDRGHRGRARSTARLFYLQIVNGGQYTAARRREPDGPRVDPVAARPDLRPQRPRARHERPDVRRQAPAGRPAAAVPTARSSSAWRPCSGMDPADINTAIDCNPGLGVRPRPDRRGRRPERRRGSSRSRRPSCPGVEVVVEARRAVHRRAAAVADPRLHGPVSAEQLADLQRARLPARRPDRQGRRRGLVRDRSARRLRRGDASSATPAARRRRSSQTDPRGAAGQLARRSRSTPRSSRTPQKALKWAHEARSASSAASSSR